MIPICGLQIAQTVKEELSKSMASFGYMIIQTLVTDIEPVSPPQTLLPALSASQLIIFHCN